MKKRICILYTGGTIGMMPSEQGYAPRPGCFAGGLAAIPELTSPDMPDWELVEMDPLLDSSNITVHEWCAIGQAIANRYHQFDGFVVLHGTDTMAYTASALSFMLENLDKPVVLTGSQIPLCQLRSDGRDNLITSLLIAAEGVVNEVSLYFGGQLLRGNRAVKSSADGLQAFSSPNYPPLATAGVDIRYNKSAIGAPRVNGPLQLAKLENVPIGVLKVFPGIQFELFDSYSDRKAAGHRAGDLWRRQHSGLRRRTAAPDPEGLRPRHHSHGVQPVPPGRSAHWYLRHQQRPESCRRGERAGHDHRGRCSKAVLPVQQGLRPGYHQALDGAGSAWRADQRPLTFFHNASKRPLGSFAKEALFFHVSKTYSSSAFSSVSTMISSALTRANFLSLEGRMCQGDFWVLVFCSISSTACS